MAIKKFTINSVEKIKEGEKNGRKWEMFRVKDDQGIEYTSFDSKDQEQIGKEVEKEVEERESFRDGQRYFNRTIRPVSEKTRQDSEVIESLKVINKNIQVLEKKIDRLLEEPEEVIDPRDIP